MDKLDVTVLTGYLGSGKTTLLNRILSERHGRRYAVIVNEFGEIGIDADLIVGADENVVAMNNGCLCCSVRGDLIQALEALLARSDRFDAILIETTGLADPVPVASTFLLDDDLSDHLALDAVVTVADAKFVQSQLEQDPVAAGQIAFADAILLNKADLVSTEELSNAERCIRGINCSAGIHRTRRCDIDLDLVLGHRTFDLSSASERSALLSRSSQHHTNGISSVALRTEEPVDPDEFMAWMQRLVRQKGRDLLRSKGIIAFAGEHRRFVFHGVQTMLDGDVTRPWCAEEKRESRLVFIGRNLDADALSSGFQACIAVSHASVQPPTGS